MKPFLIFVFVLLSAEVGAQAKEFDRLEMWYAQQHYKLVLWKANQLLDKPDYDYSHVPELYKSFALFQLAQNERWLRRHNKAVAEAASLLRNIQNAPAGKVILEAHQYELAGLKNDLYLWGEDLVRMGREDQSVELQQILSELFGGVHNLDRYVTSTQKVKQKLTVEGQRARLLSEAEKHLGVPYKWAGRSPQGFDCSGFCGYVFEKEGMTLPRRAADQYKEALSVKEKNVKPGDLVFFSNGGTVSHVGIVYAIEDGTISMIHASSSAGIVITNITQSVYWQKRITGYGRYVKD